MCLHITVNMLVIISTLKSWVSLLSLKNHLPVKVSQLDTIHAAGVME